LSGIERQYEEVLAGEPERILRIREPGGAIVREVARVSGRTPQDIRLTVDLGLQNATAQALADAYNYAAPNWAEAGRSGGAGVAILDVNTGEVLALSSWPTYDPGIFNPDTPLFLVGEYILSLRNDPRRPFFNRAIQEQYPPGSTFKIITTTAALAEGVWGADEIFTCGLRWEGRAFGDSLAERFDWRVLEEDREPAGDIIPMQALASSCNPFYYQMGALLYRRGPSVLMDYARRMGLGAATGIDLNNPPEAPGQIPPIRGTDDAITTAIGQGNVAVSILQMAHTVAGIANGGALYRPYVVAQVGEQAPRTPQLDSEMGISEAVLAEVREGMCLVTTDTTYGTAWFVFGDPEFNVPSTPYVPCGKTGTAQTGREPHGWFVAFAPQDDPQIAIAVMVENSREGSETAAPIVRRILDYYFQSPPELVAAYPGWWSETYVPLPIPEGTTGG
jgi:penicillin-binding protein 2